MSHDRHGRSTALPIRFRVMLPFALLLTAWQVWTVVGRTPSPFLLSYWFVTWDHGFIRRGLLGEVNQFFFGDDLLRGAYVLTWVCGAIAAALVGAVGIALLRLDTPFTIGLGWLMLVSPFTVKGLLNFARPDQLAIPVLALVALLWWLFPRHPARWLFVLGLVFAVITLGHEAVVLTVAPWVLLLVVHFSRGSGLAVLIGRVAAFFTVPVATVAVIIDRGGATAKQVRLLRDDAVGQLPRGENMITYLADTTADSFELVVDFGIPALTAMTLVGLCLWLVHLAALLCLPGRPPPLPLRDVAVLAFVVVPALVLQLALAKDWTRWLSLWPALGLLCLGLCLLVAHAGRDGAEAPAPRWPLRSLVVFVVLAALLFPVPRAAANNRPPCTWQVLVEDAPLPYRHLADVLAGRPHRHRGSGSVCPAP